MAYLLPLLMDRLGEDHGFEKLAIRSVHDQVSRNGFRSAVLSQIDRLQYFAEFFADCAPQWLRSLR